jgi:hypothetical protein
LMVVFEILPAMPVRTPAECHEKNLDIGSGHNTKTAWSSRRSQPVQRKKNKKYVIACVKVLSPLRSYHAPSAPDVSSLFVNQRKTSAWQLNSPLSFVHSSCFLMSSWVTVGRTLSSDLIKSAKRNGGSCSSSLSTCVQLFSTPSASPGEHGVHLMMAESGSGSTGLKCVAERTFRTGCMRESRTTTAISEPE